MLRKANYELDKENNELKRWVKDLEEENKRLDDLVRALKDKLFKLMVENEELKRRKKLDCFWSEKKDSPAFHSQRVSRFLLLFFSTPWWSGSPPLFSFLPLFFPLSIYFSKKEENTGDEKGFRS